MLRCPARFSLRIATTVGFGLDRTLSMIAYSMYLKQISKHNDPRFLIIAAGSVLCALLFLVLTGTLTNLRSEAHQNKRYVVACAFSVILGLVLMCMLDCSIYRPSLGIVLFGSSALLVSIGSAGLFFRWGCLFATDGSKDVLLQMGVGFTIALAAIVPLNLVPFGWQVVILLALCKIDAFYLCSYRPERESNAPSANTRRSTEDTSFCRKKMLIGMAFYGLSMGLSSSLLQHTGQAIFLDQSILRVFFGLLAFGVIAVVFSRKGVSTDSVYRFVYVVIALNSAAFFLLPFATAILRAFLFIGHLLLIIVCMSLLFRVAHKLPAEREPLVAFGIVAFLGGDLVARGSHDLISFTDIATTQAFSTAFALGLATIVVVGYSLVFTEHDIKRIESVLAEGPERHKEEKGVSSELDRLAYSEIAASKFELTPRETEILRLLLQGRSSPRIQSEFVHIRINRSYPHAAHLHKDGNSFTPRTH